VPAVIYINNIELHRPSWDRPKVLPMSSPSADLLGPPPAEHTLANGLKVLMRPVDTAPLVSVWCWYRVGSKNERPGITGISHWVEHMNFKGTRRISMEEMKSRIERAGGIWNGYTFVDQTTYFETAASSELDGLLELEAERMHACLYQPREVESERTVILSELQGGENDPEELLDKETTALAIQAHPYHWPTIGWESDIHVITRDALYQHYRSYYLPNNATLVLVGSFEPDAALESVKARFGDLPPGSTPPRVTTREPEQKGARRVVLERGGSTSFLRLAYPSPAFADDDFPAMLLLDAVLAGGKGLNLWSSYSRASVDQSSWLSKALVDSKLCASVNTYLIPTEQPFVYSVAATVMADASLDEAERVMADRIESLAAEVPSDKELEKARNQLLARLVFDSEGVTLCGHQMGFFETIGARGAYRRLPERIAAVTEEDLVRVSGHYLCRQRRTVGQYVPTGNAAPQSL
jgi:zinc protease